MRDGLFSVGLFLTQSREAAKGNQKMLTMKSMKLMKKKPKKQQANTPS